MEVIQVVLVILYVLVCLFLILVVLLQQGKGADLAGAFGGGGSQTAFGPRGSTNWLHKFTTYSFMVFVVLAITLSVYSGKQRSSTMDGMAEGQGATPAEEAAGEEPAATESEPGPVMTVEEGEVEGGPDAEGTAPDAGGAAPDAAPDAGEAPVPVGDGEAAGDGEASVSEPEPEES